MQVRCPECCGRRRMDYYVEPTLPILGSPDVEISATTTIEVLRDQPCRTCKGDGRVTATERIAVLQHGRRVGTVPPNFGQFGTSYGISPK